MKFILASGSQGRKSLLEDTGLDFEVIPSKIDEDLDESLELHEAIQHMALQKARAVARDVDYDALIIGADTLAVRDRIWGKAPDEQGIFEMLKSLQGKSHDVITGLALVTSDLKRELTDYARSVVTLKPMSDSEIWDYIKTGEPMGKAGGYSLQGQASRFIEKVEGSRSNVIGLPMEKLGILLNCFGMDILK